MRWYFHWQHWSFSSKLPRSLQATKHNASSFLKCLQETEKFYQKTDKNYNQWRLTEGLEEIVSTSWSPNWSTSWIIFHQYQKPSSLHDIIILYSEIPQFPVFLIEIPYVHSVVVGYQLVTSSSLHVVYLRFEVMWFTRLAHLNDAKYHSKDCCTNIQVLSLQSWGANQAFYHPKKGTQNRSVFEMLIEYRSIEVHPCSNRRKEEPWNETWIQQNGNNLATSLSYFK